jgi:hypothetical protein
VISVVLTRRELVNSRETVYTGYNEINMLDSKSESSCDHESARPYWSKEIPTRLLTAL